MATASFDFNKLRNKKFLMVVEFLQWIWSILLEQH